MLLWQPKGNVNKPVGELPGHASGVAHLLVADAQSQVGIRREQSGQTGWNPRRGQGSQDCHCCMPPLCCGCLQAVWLHKGACPANLPPCRPLPARSSH